MVVGWLRCHFAGGGAAEGGGWCARRREAQGKPVGTVEGAVVAVVLLSLLLVVMVVVAAADGLGKGKVGEKEMGVTLLLFPISLSLFSFWATEALSAAP